MEGFLNIRLPAWLRRLITRLIAIVPAVIVTAMYGEHGAGTLLILSQVILSLQLSFAVVPLVHFTSERAKMGDFVNGPAAQGGRLGGGGGHHGSQRLAPVRDLPRVAGLIRSVARGPSPSPFALLLSWTALVRSPSALRTSPTTAS